MDPTVLQQLYSSKHTVKVSSEYAIDNGKITKISDHEIKHIYHTPTNRYIMIEPQISDICHDLPIKICWERWHFNCDELIDYQYMAQQCINDPSTIKFGFEFTNGPSSGGSHSSVAQFEIDSNAHIFKIMPHSRERVPCQTLDMIVEHIKHANDECDFFTEFCWTRRISGILECLGG